MRPGEGRRGLPGPGTLAEEARRQLRWRDRIDATAQPKRAAKPAVQIGGASALKVTIARRRRRQRQQLRRRQAEGAAGDGQQARQGAAERGRRSPSSAGFGGRRSRASPSAPQQRVPRRFQAEAQRPRGQDHSPEAKGRSPSRKRRRLRDRGTEAAGEAQRKGGRATDAGARAGLGSGRAVRRSPHAQRVEERNRRGLRPRGGSPPPRVNRSSRSSSRCRRRPRGRRGGEAGSPQQRGDQGSDAAPARQLGSGRAFLRSPQAQRHAAEGRRGVVWPGVDRSRGAGARSPSSARRRQQDRRAVPEESAQRRRRQAAGGAAPPVQGGGRAERGGPAGQQSAEARTQEVWPVPDSEEERARAHFAPGREEARRRSPGGRRRTGMRARDEPHRRLRTPGEGKLRAPEGLGTWQ